MAARSPSSFNQYNDETALYPRQEIITTVPSAVADDQQFCLEVERLLLADVFPPYSSTAAALEQASGTYYFVPKLHGATHDAGAAIATTVLCWASDASDFTVRVDRSPGVFIDFSITANHTDKVFRAFDATDIVTTAVPQSVTLYVRRDAGSGTINLETEKPGAQGPQDCGLAQRFIRTAGLTGVRLIRRLPPLMWMTLQGTPLIWNTSPTVGCGSNFGTSFSAVFVIIAPPDVCYSDSCQRRASVSW
jgi:hypothetical protein